jgi:hypothetical protein
LQRSGSGGLIDAIRESGEQNVWRTIGGGPVFRNFRRRVLCRLRDLDDWAVRRACDSTSDDAWKQQ